MNQKYILIVTSGFNKSLNNYKYAKIFYAVAAFSIVDGRLSTNIYDVYDILNHVCDDNLMSHHLPTALKYLKLKNPDWLKGEMNALEFIKVRLQSNTFETLIGVIQDEGDEEIKIPQLKDEFDTSDFGNYMIENSILIKKL